MTPSLVSLLVSWHCNKLRCRAALWASSLWSSGKKKRRSERCEEQPAIGYHRIPRCSLLYLDLVLHEDHQLQESDIWVLSLIMVDGCVGVAKLLEQYQESRFVVDFRFFKWLVLYPVSMDASGLQWQLSTASR